MKNSRGVKALRKAKHILKSSFAKESIIARKELSKAIKATVPRYEIVLNNKCKSSLKKAQIDCRGIYRMHQPLKRVTALVLSLSLVLGMLFLSIQHIRAYGEYEISDASVIAEAAIIHDPNELHEPSEPEFQESRPYEDDGSKELAYDNEEEFYPEWEDNENDLQNECYEVCEYERSEHDGGAEDDEYEFEGDSEYDGREYEDNSEDDELEFEDEPEDESEDDELELTVKLVPFDGNASGFSQEEIDDPLIWYAVPDYVIILESAPLTASNNPYTRLRAAIQAAPANSVTHIMIPFHFNTGPLATGANVVGVRAGATVVLIGNHPDVSNGQSVISNTQGGTAAMPTFALRGNGTERSAVVIRNIIIQRSGTSAVAVPATPPNPTPLPQTAGGRGGGVTIENAAVSGIASGGGGNLVLCRGGIIRNTSSINNGPIDIQNGGRFTMMPGSLMHSNQAENAGGAVEMGANSIFTMRGGMLRNNIALGTATVAASVAVRGRGGAVHMGGTNSRFHMHDGIIEGNIASNAGGAIAISSSNAIFTMHNGVIRENRARGENTTATNVATTRGNGGGVAVFAGGTFNMHGGEVYENHARLGMDINVPTPSATNAVVTSNGGGVFVTGTSSTFNMYGGTIRNNEAVRAFASNVNEQPTRQAFRAGNGGGVYLTTGATFNMHGGNIENNLATAIGTALSSPNGGNALNLSNGGGVYLTGAGTRFYMHNGIIRYNRAVRAVSSVPTMSPLTPGVPGGGTMTVLAGNGGGVHVYDDAVFTMNGGNIYENLATATGTDPANNTDNFFFLSNGGGVFVSGTAVSGVIANARFFMNGGTIRDNHVIGAAAAASTFSGNGGGVGVMNRARFYMTGGVISGNTATDNNTTTTPSEGLRRGNGAGLYLSRGFTVPGAIHLSFHMSGGEIRDHTTITRHGVAIFMSGGRVEIDGTAQITNNHSPNNGGGIFVETNGTLNISGGTISENTARQDGGGIFLSATDIVLNMQGGEIRDNLANNGGGLFVPHSNVSTNLNNITINPAVTFTGNVARHGVRIDNAFAAAHRPPARNPGITPGTVSLSGAVIISETPPIGSNNFAQIAPHAFTNFDINSTPPFWRVTHEVGRGEGDVTAVVGNNNLPVPSNSFVQNNAQVRFLAESLQQFEGWEIGTRNREIDDNDQDVPFSFIDIGGEEHALLMRTITSNTHAIGNFAPEPDPMALIVSKIVTGSDGNLFRDFGFTLSVRVPAEAPNTGWVDFTQPLLYIITGNGIPTDEPIEGSITDGRFYLRHGQQIQIIGIPLGAEVRIIEDANSNYNTSIYSTGIDFGEHEDLKDTGWQSVSVDRVFVFTNDRRATPQTAFVVDQGISWMMIAGVLFSAMAVMWCVTNSLKHRIRWRNMRIKIE